MKDEKSIISYDGQYVNQKSEIYTMIFDPEFYDFVLNL